MHDAAEDRRLLIACRSGDEPAAREFYARHVPALIAYARCVVGDVALAEDTVHSVMLRVLDTPRRKIKRIEHVRAWLVTCTRNEARDMLRRRRRAESREQARASSIESAAPMGSEAEELSLALLALSEPEQEVVYLKHAAGLTFDEIAHVTDENRNTQASRYRAAIKKLGERVSEQAALEVSEQ